MGEGGGGSVAEEGSGGRVGMERERGDTGRPTRNSTGIGPDPGDMEIGLGKSQVKRAAGKGKRPWSGVGWESGSLKAPMEEKSSCRYPAVENRGPQWFSMGLVGRRRRAKKAVRREEMRNGNWAGARRERAERPNQSGATQKPGQDGEAVEPPSRAGIASRRRSGNQGVPGPLFAVPADIMRTVGREREMVMGMPVPKKGSRRSMERFRQGRNWKA